MIDVDSHLCYGQKLVRHFILYGYSTSGNNDSPPYRQTWLSYVVKRISNYRYLEIHRERECWSSSRRWSVRAVPSRYSWLVVVLPLLVCQLTTKEGLRIMRSLSHKVQFSFGGKAGSWLMRWTNNRGRWPNSYKAKPFPNKVRLAAPK